MANVRSGPDGFPSECVLALEAPLSCSFGAADKGASCCGMHSEGNPSGPFVLGLQGLGLKGIMARFALNVECGEGFLRPAECA